MQQDYILSLSFDRGITYVVLNIYIIYVEKKLLTTVNEKTVQGHILKLALLTHFRNINIIC